MSTSEYNSDELVPPSFLNESFVVKLLKTVEKDDDVQLVSFEIKPGSGKGDHYASIMFKIIASYSTKEDTVTDRRFIMKTLPEAGKKKDLLKDSPVFTNELLMYTEALPAMEDILRRHGQEPWWPRLVYHSTTPLVLVFNDLTQNNFQMIHQPLGMEQISVVVEKIAKYHALSMIIAESDKPKVVTQFQKGFNMESMRPIMMSLMRQAKNLGKEVQTWPGFERIGVNIECSMDKHFDNFTAAYKTPSKCGFNVLNHGDFHIRNMMFRKDDQDVIRDVSFLDFQVPLYLTPGFDIVYMIGAMGNRDVRMRKPEVIKMYHRELVKGLQVYGFTGAEPTLIDVNKEILQVAPFEAFQTLCFCIFQLDLTGVELGELFNNNDESPMASAMKQLYKDPGFMEEMKSKLKYFDSLGVFD